MANSPKWENAKTVAEVVAPILTLAALVWGIIQYNKNSEMEFRKNFYTQQTQVYDNLIDLTGKIASYDIDSLDTREFRLLCNNLTGLYYGKLNVYEDNLVDSLVKDYMTALDRFKNYEEGIDNDFMRGLCRKISLTCRESMESTFGINFKDFKPSLINNQKP